MRLEMKDSECLFKYKKDEQTHEIALTKDYLKDITDAFVLLFTQPYSSDVKPSILEIGEFPNDIIYSFISKEKTIFHIYTFEHEWETYSTDNWELLFLEFWESLKGIDLDKYCRIYHISDDQKAKIITNIKILEEMKNERK